MKVGLISDVHAQLSALERALDILLTQHVDVIVCSGDLVDKGPDGDAVVDQIHRHLIPCVQGNHDLNAVRHAALSPNTAHDELSRSTIEQLDALPSTRQYDWHGQRIFIAHGTPLRCDSYCFPHKVPKDFRRWASTTPADIVVLGHTHRPMLMRYGQMLVINPGSVCTGRTRDSHTCAILDLHQHHTAFFDLTDGAQIARIKNAHVQGSIPIT